MNDELHFPVPEKQGGQTGGAWSEPTTSCDTSRTENAKMPFDQLNTFGRRPDFVVHADFARQLERELNAVQAERDISTMQWKRAGEQVGRQWKELSVLRAENAELRKDRERT